MRRGFTLIEGEKTMKKIMMMAMVVGFALAGCEAAGNKNSDKVQRQQQELVLKESTAQTGMPAIKNFRERKLLKEIIELRDQDGLTTYTYIVAEMTGKLVFLGESIGYGIPYATQYTNPQKIADQQYQTGYAILPQADPNGLFFPSSADGTWVMLKDPNGGNVRPVLVEPRCIVSPFRLH